MRNAWKWLAASVLAGAAAGPLHAEIGPYWTAEAVVEAPRVVQTAIAADGSAAVYIVRRDHVKGDFRDSTLVQVNPSTGSSRNLLTARWISNVRQIPGQQAWSVLADVGKGVQLYRISRTGRLQALLVRAPLVNVGANAASTVIPSPSEPLQAFGVLDYGWSPDGAAFWYSCAIDAADPPPKSPFVEMPTVSKISYQANRSELHVVAATGEDRLVATARGFPDWPLVFYSADAANWSLGTSSGLELNYTAPSDGDSGNHATTDWHYDLRAKKSAPGRVGTLAALDGPGGGLLKVLGHWSDRTLVEDSADGRRKEFGHVDFVINSGWNPGVWKVQGQAATLIAVRHDGLNVRNSLIKLSSDGTLSEFESVDSLDSCSFTPDAAQGVCVREGLATPPRIVSIDGRLGTQTPLGPVDAAYERIIPLHYEPHLWRAGTHSATGFVLYPRNYAAGQKYPAIILTHGEDAANRFVDVAFQWSYPAQVLAEKGYVVIYINDIPLHESDVSEAAYSQWASGQGTLSRTSVQNIIWLDQLAIYRQALDQLAGEGTIDAGRVGIAGYSRGAQMVAVAVTQTDLFRAASLGEGTIFAPSSYWMGDNYRIYGELFGGPPFDEKWRPDWERLSPTYRAAQAHGAVLFQMSNMTAGAVDFYQALRAANVPADFAFFPGETHLPNIPSDRLEIMRENLNWFDYWLADRNGGAKSARGFSTWRQQ